MTRFYLVYKVIHCARLPTHSVPQLGLKAGLSQGQYA